MTYWVYWQMAANHGSNNKNNNTLSTSLPSIVRIKSPRTNGNQSEDSRSFIVVARNQTGQAIVVRWEPTHVITEETLYKNCRREVIRIYNKTTQEFSTCAVCLREIQRSHYASVHSGEMNSQHTHEFQKCLNWRNIKKIQEIPNLRTALSC